MLAYIKHRHDAGALSVTADEILAAVIPPDQPKLRHKPAYRYGIQRLRVRSEINAVDAPDGTTHYFIGDYPSNDLRASLGLR
ncbi:MAG: hypothetical protein DCC68_01585 [Planctomycetota bacterium]|nr:MAG: hypothetical protein DCC68_01585 [Planctomycetota bacterium]